MAANSTRITTIKRFRLQDSKSTIELLDVDCDNGGDDPGLTIRYRHDASSEGAETLLSLNAVDTIMFRAALQDLFGGTL